MILALVLLAHSWYPRVCCGGEDCRPIPCAEIRSYGDYWVWKSHEFRKDKTLPSEDGGCHVCTGNGEDDGVAICLFMGGMS